MTVLAILFLIVLGGALLVLEFLLLPGLVVGILGFLMQVAGVWTSFHYYGSATGGGVLAITVALDALLMWLIFRSGIWKKISLQTELKGRVNTLDDTPVHQGDTGITVSRLAPGGKASINGFLIEVNSTGDFIDVQQPIEVVKVQHGKVTVRLKH